MGKLNIVIGTHGRFGEELIKSVEMVIGPLEQVYCVSLLPSESFEEFMNKADSVLGKLQEPSIVLVDLFGGTPCNVFTILTNKYNHQVITGLNLPVLIDLYLKNDMESTEKIDTLVEHCIEVLKASAVHTNGKLQ